MSKGKVYLIPNVLGENTYELSIPDYNSSAIKHITRFIVEDPKAARALLKKANLDAGLDNILFYSMSKKRASDDERQELLKALLDGEDLGMISDAGLPAVADPGDSLIAYFHTFGIEMIPLVGPSSIMLALMASGLNGQQFAFHGYLPKERPERVRELKRLEQVVLQKKITQIFIETPYRNHHLREDILSVLNGSIRLCIACNLLTPKQKILMKSIAEWKRMIALPDIDKQPAVFLIG
jgi:16S rRNA (cytidine1402-2'-O)-methyltransferase